ncbi:MULTISPECIES: hypothetical protein [Flavobacterium]|uniref:Uncharacterized protein n=1 Tax=Flavobacterium ranwuense TaxID=2541725 RepID=A0ABY2DQL9_9FLAO|nr:MULTISPECIES: hypothetical protein [Flavobacterium]TDE28329.1 hypothetical protein E0I61_12430 [Flavobacterium ranwuense]TDE52582.1 hypothetical protein E0H99_10655 [Flavobacterium sp. GT3P67]
MIYSIMRFEKNKTCFYNLNYKVVDHAILQFEILNNFVLSPTIKVKSNYYIIRLQIPIENED